MAGLVVADASLAFKWIVTEHDSELADALAESWSVTDVQIAAPQVLLAEVANAVHRRIADKELSVEGGVLAFERILRFDIQVVDTSRLWVRALELASQLDQGAVYDSHYLALAESLECELWTADTRFHRAARGRYPSIRLLAEFDALT